MVEDVRIIKNKRNIEAALINLLKEKDFIHITIKDICEASLTSRSTFYSHYLDKYDLLEKIVHHYADLIKQKAQVRFFQMQSDNIETFIKEMAQTYLQHQEDLKVLLKVHTPNGDLRAKIEEILFSQCHNFLQEQQKMTIVSKELLARLYVANVFALINWILEHGVDDQTIHFANEVQNYIFKISSV
ncbi:TetR/AcrR family transcriptional regulator [Clostridium estertheticum]|uniref:TetR/AcrR family transcriptional regulator n=1 Tax=Clostridium estertheticum TaxID=238834 RepID=UPI00124D241B|nr:TetR/AcrR family transcriptional regulator [Clostridium estertheticum]MBU3171719.1 TetR/AcrR family transcriptional regulator [Clostridium estertheticum]MBZ9618411.1 TetR/AcrR family transcriptional regulator [Clostridium estertheticum subsp. laramiense]WAG76352.1 TetR/AcrR family transcriptional regulator [Clostridium estertheticum]